MVPFTPRDWERERIHAYSVHPPLWWRLWVKLRTAGTKIGIQ